MAKRTVRKSRGKNKSKNNSMSKELLKKMKTKVASKVRQYKKQKKRTKRVSKTTKRKKTDKGSLKLLSKIKRFLRADVSSATPLPVSEIARMTIKGPSDEKLIEDVGRKLTAVQEYWEEQGNQPYCSVCNDQPNGCHACNQHN